jgi:sn-glycerol 3-phosphate transport system ATP-binding protein
LFDEPLSNLDASLRGQTRVEIARLHRNLGATTIYVTHDQTEAMTLADRIVVLDAGRVIQVGTPRELYNHPVNTFVAQFIGSPAMNILEANVSGGTVSLGNGAALPTHSAYSGSVKVGIRPEHLQSDPVGPIELKVAFSEPLGATTLLYGTLAGSDEPITASLPGVYRGEGDTVKLSIASEHLHLFDYDQGARITT